MKVERIELENALKNKLQQLAFDEVGAKNLYDSLETDYEVPTGLTMDVISGRCDLSNVPPIVLYGMADKLLGKRLATYYTENEMLAFKKAKYEDPNKIKFPLYIHCIQVADDQWIGATDSKFLIGLYRQQVINYNINTQRVMRKIVKGESVSYKIELNKKAVREISSSYKDGTFISNTITLNMSDESEADYYYDESERVLVIKSIKFFDIIDGYHRLIALSQTVSADEEFNYPMELRIVTFSEDKARQLIYQEDQKTRMTKVASASMNMNSDSNFIVEKLNSSMDSNLKGLINRNAGIINFADMAAIISRVYYMNKTNITKSTRLNVAKDLKMKFNLITDEHPEWLNNPISMKKIYCLIVLFERCDITDAILAKSEVIMRDESVDKLDIKTIASARGLKLVSQYVSEV